MPAARGLPPASRDCQAIPPIGTATTPSGSSSAIRPFRGRPTQSLDARWSEPAPQTAEEEQDCVVVGAHGRVSGPDAVTEHVVRYLEEGEEMQPLEFFRKDTGTRGVLEPLTGDHEAFELPRVERAFSLGRHRSNTLQLKDVRISGLHCSVAYDASTNAYYLQDHSHNGTWLRRGDKRWLLRRNRAKLMHADVVSVIASYICPVHGISCLADGDDTSACWHPPGLDQGLSFRFSLQDEGESAEAHMLPRPDNPTQPDLPAPDFIQPPHRAESFDTDKQKGEGGEWGQSVGAAVIAVARTNDLQDEEEPPPPPPSPPPPPPPLAPTVLAVPGTARPAVSTKPPAPPGRRRRPLTPAALSSHASHDASGCQSRRHLFDQPRPSKAADAGVVRDRSGGADKENETNTQRNLELAASISEVRMWGRVCEASPKGGSASKAAHLIKHTRRLCEKAPLCGQPGRPRSAAMAQTPGARSAKPVV